MMGMKMLLAELLAFRSCYLDYISIFISQLSNENASRTLKTFSYLMVVQTFPTPQASFLSINDLEVHIT